MEKNLMGMSLQLDTEYIKNLTKEIIKQGMVETLGNENLVGAIVSEILNKPVDENGKVATSSYSRSKPMLQYLVDKELREQIVEIAKEAIEEKKPAIREAIKKEMQKKATIDQFVSKFYSSIIDNLHSSYRTQINVNIESEKEQY